MLAKGIKVALVASPVVLAANPSHAFQQTFTGFTDAFQGPSPSAWTNQSTNGGTRNFTTTQLTLTKGANSTGKGGVSYATSVSVFDDYKPAGAGNFTTGTYSFNWRYRFTPGSQGTATQPYQFAFQPFVGTETSSPLNSATQAANTWTDFAAYNGSVVADQTFGFNINSLFTGGNGIATVEITDFQFIANYADVPGPLPLAGAAVAFAWSRKLRNRLKTVGLNS
jgi:hypothetical protein